MAAPGQVLSVDVKARLRFGNERSKDAFPYRRSHSLLPKLLHRPIRRDRKRSEIPRDRIGSLSNQRRKDARVMHWDAAFPH
jgi:hypothetical protein